ncbi:hypothetical protein [Acinetobacter wuhouensis]|uniref:DUF2570 domain-containing protein n=1 Tax=Acinetobacter wuhouensis TaxID=1879050 RepID=A0A4V2DND1_9GAMM|nr:hypothetical protein [Acinetobacter wuhouensis]RZG48054.1 hypothetical protein EXU28_04610 [Acinetobacter wuhouensis]
MIILWKYKKWIAIVVFFVLWLGQIAYTNHLAGKLEQAESQCTAKIQKIKDDQQNALVIKQNKINQVSADYEQLKSEQRVKVETVTREVQKIVTQPIYSNVCFDDDGLQQLNSLIINDSS